MKNPDDPQPTPEWSLPPRDTPAPTETAEPTLPPNIELGEN